MTVLIGLHGRRGSGKDTTFHYIREWAEERGVRAVKRGFADDVKWSFARLFMPDCSRAEAVTWCDHVKHCGTLTISEEFEEAEPPYAGQVNRREQSISGRMALQRHGTEAHREVFDDNFWVDNLLPTDFVYSHPESVPRHTHEAPTLKWPLNFTGDNPFESGLGPPHIAVITDLRFVNEAERIIELGGKCWYINREMHEERDAHASEVLLPPYYLSQEIPNNSDLDQLRSNVHATMEILYGEKFKKQEMSATQTINDGLEI